MPVNALHVLRRHGAGQARAASAAFMTERPASVDTRRPVRARLEKGQPDSPTARQPDSPTARQPDSPTARQPDSPTARQPDSPTARQPDSPTARQPDSPTARQPDSPTARQPDSPTLGEPGAARRGARSSATPSGPAPSHASVKPRPPARGLLRAALCALALVTLLCGLATPAAAQLSPSSVTVTRGDRQIVVAWTAPAGADGTTDATTVTGYAASYTDSPTIAPSPEVSGWRFDLISIPATTSTTFTGSNISLEPLMHVAPV